MVPMQALKVKTKNSGSFCEDKQGSYENSVNTEKYTREAWESQTYLVKPLPLINQSACVFGAKEVIPLPDRQLPVLKT